MLALFFLVIATSLNVSLEVSDRANKHAATATKTTPGREDFAAWMLPSSITEVEAKDSLSKGSQVPTENVADDHSALPKPIAAPQVNLEGGALHVFRPGTVAVIAARVHGRELVAQPVPKHANALAEGALEEATENASSDDLSRTPSALSPSLKTDTASEVDTSNKSDDVSDVFLARRTELGQISEAPAGTVAHGSGNLNDVEPKPDSNECSHSARSLTKHSLHRPSVAPDMTTSSAKPTMVTLQDSVISMAQLPENSASHVTSPAVVLSKENEAGISASRTVSKQSVRIDSARQAETGARPIVVAGNETVDPLDEAPPTLQLKDIADNHCGLASTHETTTQTVDIHQSADVTFAYSFRHQAHSTQDENEDTTVSERGIEAVVESTGPIKGSQPVQRLDVSVDDPVLGNIGLRAEMRGGSLHASISGDTDVAASLPDLHQFLQRNEIAVHTLTMRHAESPAPLADTTARMIGTGSALAQGGNSDAQRQGGSQRREPWGAERNRESSAREEADMKVQQTSFTKPTATDANQGSILSIHI